MPADEIINLDDYPIIGVEDPIDEGLQGSASEWGPQISYLYTNGNELWLSNLDLGINLQYVAQQESIEMARGKLNETNSYVGWYHIRNYGSTFQRIVPKSNSGVEYDLLTEPICYNKNEWFKEMGFDFLANPTAVETIRGCTNSNAWNYNPLANEDDGTCWIVPGYLLGAIPAETMNNLHTHGGELTYHDSEMEYQGYYHVHGPGDLPPGVTAGQIMAGREYDGNNELLIPINPSTRFLNQGWADFDDSEAGTGRKQWTNSIKMSNTTDTSQEYRNASANIINITVDTTSAGQNKDYYIIDNAITMPTAVGIMENTDYQFTELIPDMDKSPGLFGSKPKMKSNLNEIDLAEYEPVALDKFDLTENVYPMVDPDSESRS